jgi:twinkle protein
MAKETIEWFEKTRHISNDTLLRLGVSEAVEWMPKANKEIKTICFNYIRGGELVNIKFRGKNKDFKLTKDAELIFYNLDALEGDKTAVIVEGEIDSLSMHEAGVFNSVSVPNGASKGSQKLEYLDNCIDYFIDKTKIILATDADDAGFALREELARRLGKERCYRVSYPEDCKDANEVLVKHGKEALKQMVENATVWPIEGLIAMDDIYEDVCNYYENGYPDGIKVGIDGFDDYLQLLPGQLTTITGIPGSGKSEFTDYLMCMTAKNHKWPWGVCSFENQPVAFHVTKLIEKMAGKAFGFRKDHFNRVNTDEFQYAVGLIDLYFHFININQVELTINGLLDKATELVMRKGIKGLLIDPWNYIEHKIPKGYTETQYISECLTQIKTFAVKTGVHVFLIAHPTKLRKLNNGKYEVPTLYNISGSAHFFNKTDNGVTVWRDFENNTVDVHVQKVRYSWLGKVGFCSFSYDIQTRQYLRM